MGTICKHILTHCGALHILLSRLSNEAFDVLGSGRAMKACQPAGGDSAESLPRWRAIDVHGNTGNKDCFIVG